MEGQLEQVDALNKMIEQGGQQAVDAGQAAATAAADAAGALGISIFAPQNSATRLPALPE